MHLYPSTARRRRYEQRDTVVYLDAMWSQVIVGVDPDPSKKEKMISWARDYWRAASHSAGGAYVNMIMDEGDDRISAAYGNNFARLAKIKKRYDPKNLFRVNQNIKPAAA